jgi:cytochrome c oxidase accessory protein FixG
MSTSAPNKAIARRPDLDSLYCLNADGSRNTIHTADVRGRYQTFKRWLWVFLIAIYLAMPWITINGRPAILIDIPHRTFYVFGMTFNAQDFYLFFFVITGIAFSLYVVSALFGRVWCGYTCPHTVFLEGVYRRIERWFDGDAVRRKKLAERAWDFDKTWRRLGKWSVFAGLSLLLAHTFLSYFMPAPEVWKAVTGPPSAHPAAFTFVIAFSLIVYLNFAWFREQLCIVICPYGRLQGVLYDRDTIQVAYDTKRGEPRGRYTDPNAADCIDCQRCIAVCPTGIDIRNGTQLECVGCANCIDACDEVMTKVGRPTGLIRYDSQNGIETGERKFVRPRLFVYAALMLVGISAATLGFMTRRPFEANLLRMAGTAFERTADDGIQNLFNLHVVNKLSRDAEFRIRAGQGLPDGTSIKITKTELALDRLGGERSEEWVPVVVTVPDASYEFGQQVEIVIEVVDGPTRTASATMLGPRRFTTGNDK